MEIKLQIVILSQIIRLFTTKFYKEFFTGAFDQTKRCEELRKRVVRPASHIDKV